MAIEFNNLLEYAAKLGVSDVHLQEHRPPAYRIAGELQWQHEIQPLKKEDMVRFMDLLLDDDRKRKIFAQTGSVDVSYSIGVHARFRVNIFKQYSGLTLVARYIPNRILRLDELGLPPTMEAISQERRGLVLITGTTGSGKSTTLASLLEQINQTRSCHILTIEDPVEFMLQGKQAIINQREIGDSTDCFSSALRAGLRQDPDVMLLGELRDKETIDTALHAAETGHLVFATMHTLDAVKTVDRIVSVFPPHHQKEIRRMVSSVLKWVVSQRLLRKKSLDGRVPACEIMRVTQRVKELILAGADGRELLDDMEKSSHVYGSQTFDHGLMKLYKSGSIALDEALANCTNPSDFKLKVSGILGQ